VHADCENLGSIILGVVGGVGNYTFDWNPYPVNGPIPQPQNRFDLNPGIYSVTIQDEGGCEFIINNILVEDRCNNGECSVSAGSISIEEENICFENNNTISATLDDNTVVGPNFQVIYMLTEQNGNNLIVVDTSSAPNFDITETGIFTIHTLVYDPLTLDLNLINFGSTSIFEINSLLQQGGGDICGALDLNGATAEVSEIKTEITTNTPDNCNSSNGNVILSPDNYSYQWSDNGIGANRNNLNTGIYQVTATDNNGCTTTIDIEVRDTCICIEPSIADINIIESSCGLQNGSAEIVVDGNPLNYTFDWSTSAGTPNSIGNKRSNLQAGVYTVTIGFSAVTDCEIVETFSIGNIDGPKVDSILTTPTTCSAPDGSVTLYPDTYDYIWVTDDGATTNTRADLKPGRHSIVVINPLAPQCPDIITIEIDSTNTMIVTADIISEPQCGVSDGEVTINVANSNTNNFTYIWSDNQSINQAARTELGQGDYTVTVIDQSTTACETILDFTLNEQAVGATLTMDPIVAINCNGERGELIYEVTYDNNFIQPASIFITNDQNAPFDADNLIPGEYIIEIEDANGCRGAVQNFTVTEPEALIVTNSITNIECEAPGQIDLTVSGGCGTYTYNWGHLSGTENPQNITTNNEGLYIVTVTDCSGCEKVLFGQYIGDNCDTDNCPPNPNVNNIIVQEASCGQNNGSIFMEVTGGAPSDFIFNWEPDISNNNSADSISSGIYTVNILHANNPYCPPTIQTIEVGNIDGPEAVVVFSAPSGCTSADGSITYLR